MLGKEDGSQHDTLQTISITSLLKRMWPSPGENNVTAEEIAQAVSFIFTNQLSPVQAGALLTCLHFTGWDQRPNVLSKCAISMRDAALQVDYVALSAVVAEKQKARYGQGDYKGGLCDIVGTGGDCHNTFNVSTTASILASSLLLMAKSGNHASTSKSGSADLLLSTSPTAPNLKAVTPENICKIYEKSNYNFLYAPNFHYGMKYVAPIRKDLGWRTIFNLLGPLTNPVEQLIEARILGVARKEIGPVYAEALRTQGADKTLIVCGEESLDEISCAGKTFCWRISSSSTSNIGDKNDCTIPNTSIKEGDKSVWIETFTLFPSDFGLPSHPLSSVSPGKEPLQNAQILMKLLRNQLPEDDPILHFVLMNTSALFVLSGICEADESNMGKGDNGVTIDEKGPGGGRWKEGVRRARWAITSGEAFKQWENFVQVSNSFH